MRAELSWTNTLYFSAFFCFIAVLSPYVSVHNFEHLSNVLLISTFIKL